MDAIQATDVLSALAQASRLAVVRKLVAREPEGACAGDLAELLDIPANTLSFHLKTLAHAGLVTGEQSGRYIRYRARLEQVQGLVAFLTDHCCGGDPSRCEPTARDVLAPAKRKPLARARR